MIDLEFLTSDPSRRSLCYDYWAIDDEGHFNMRVADVASKHGLKATEVLPLTRESCVARCTVVRCPSCGQHVVLDHRSALGPLLRSQEGSCSACRQQVQARQAEAASRELERQQRVVGERYALISAASIQPAELSMRDAVSLLAVSRTGASESYSHIRAIHEWEKPLNLSYSRGALTVVVVERK